MHEVCIQRTEGQVFRERVGFVILCIIGAYCAMRILVELKSILQPFLWALFLVMAWKPMVDALERRIEQTLAGCCSCFRAEPLEEVVTDDDVRGGELNALLEDTELQAMGNAVSAEETAADGQRRRHLAAARGGLAAYQDLDGDSTSRSAWRTAIARGLAVLTALLLTLAILSGFGFLILESARRVRSHWDVYQRGARNLAADVVRVLGYMFHQVPDSIKLRYEAVTVDVMKTAQDLIYGLLGEFVNNVSSILLGGLLTLLYTLLWLCSPVPMGSSVHIMFRRYIMFKTLACLGFGVCVGMLLAFLSVDLASVFALTTFALNYVPEVGPFVAMVLPCPVILLDSRLERPFLVLITAIIGQLALKFAFSNIIEVKLIESDKKMRMHPVMILLSVGIFGYLWGPTGMLLSVPLMALLKISLFSDLVPASYRDPILVLLEGDRNAPSRHMAAVQPAAGLRKRAVPGG